MKSFYKIRPVYFLMAGFALFLISLCIVFFGSVPDAPALIALYSTMIIAGLIVAKRGNASLDIAFTVIYIVAVFESLGLLVHRINPKDIDPVLIRADYILFGGYPTVMLEAVHNPLLTELSQIAYSSYYFIPIALGVVLKARGKEAEFQKSFFLIVLCFLLSYVGYILWPALGPRYAMEHLQGIELAGLFLADDIQRLLNSLEGIKRDAFPSGHTAITLLVLWLAYIYEKKLFWLFLPIISLLVFSTVYCRYHYAVDVIAGAALAVLTVLGGRLYERFSAAR